MSKTMLIDAAHPEEVRVAVVNNGKVEDFDFESQKKRQLRGNIYLAKVTRVEPSLQAAFVDYGGNRHGFLAFSEIHPDYYHLPQEDREALTAEATAEMNKSDDVDDVEDDEDGEERPKPALPPSRRYKIQEVIKRRQILLVQVVKEERGNKGAALTTYLSLAGRYGVLMPNTPRGGGISRKITNASDRKRIKKIVSELEVPQGMGLIVRTAGAKRTKTEIKRDFEYLVRVWSKIKDLTFNSIAPALIHEEGGLVHRAMRDLYDKDIDSVLVDGEPAYREAKDLAKMLMPSHARKVQQNKSGHPVFVDNKIEDQLNNIFSPEVQLKSGGYLVIHQTEALVAVDVNSGRATKERNIENTALRTNLEAAEEVCRQMRLRDLAGLIVIDFIDMEENKNNRAVERKMKECLKHDRARVQNGKISMFGLMEISRQRRRAGILESSSDPCPHCNGTGRVRSVPSAALQLLRSLEARAHGMDSGTLVAEAPTDVVVYALNEKRSSISDIENGANIDIRLVASQAMLTGDFSISTEKAVVSADADASSSTAETETPAPTQADGEQSEKPSRRRRRRRGKKDAEETTTTDAMSIIDEDGEAVEGETTETKRSDAAGDGSEEPKKRRRRGRRGGRKRRSGGETVTPVEVSDLAPEDGGSVIDGETVAAEIVDADQLIAPVVEVETATVVEDATSETETNTSETAQSETEEASEAIASAKSVEPVMNANDVAETETAVETATSEAESTADTETEALAVEVQVEDTIIATETATADTATPETTDATEAADDVIVKEEPKKERKRRGWWQRNPLSS